MDSDTPSTGKGPVANLAARRAAGQVRADPVQEKIVERLQAVHDQLAAMAAHAPAKQGFWARLGFGLLPAPAIRRLARARHRRALGRQQSELPTVG